MISYWSDYSQGGFRMEGNDNLEVKDLRRKMEVLFNYEKELIKENKKQSHRTDIIEDEINNIKKFRPR